MIHGLRDALVSLEARMDRRFEAMDRPFESIEGPDSMFQVDDGKLASPGPSRLSRAMVGDGVVKLRRELLSRRGGQ